MRPLLRSLLTLAMASLPAASFAQEPLDLLAPANRWTTTGGSPSRSGATRTRAVRGPVEIAWTHDAGGGIEGEPLVWDDVVLVSVARSDDLRVLRALDLLTGEPLVTDRIVRSKKPLVPSLWRNVVVYRGDENQMVAARIGKSRMSEIWSTRTAESVGPPLLVGERVYATTWRELACYALGRRAPLWSAPGQFGGAVSLSKHQAFAVAGNSASVGLGQFELATGRALAQRYVEIGRAHV